MAYDLCHWAATFQGLAWIRGTGILRFRYLVRFIRHHRSEWVLLVQPLHLVGIANSLLALRLIHILHCLYGKCWLRNLLVQPTTNMTLSSVQRPLLALCACFSEIEYLQLHLVLGEHLVVLLEALLLQLTESISFAHQWAVIPRCLGSILHRRGSDRRNCAVELCGRGTYAERGSICFGVLAVTGSILDMLCKNGLVRSDAMASQ